MVTILTVVVDSLIVRSNCNSVILCGEKSFDFIFDISKHKTARLIKNFRPDSYYGVLRFYKR